MMNSLNSNPFGFGASPFTSPLAGPASPLGAAPLGNAPMGAPQRDPYQDLAAILMVMLQAMNQGQPGQGMDPNAMGQNPGLDPLTGAGPGAGIDPLAGAGLDPFGGGGGCPTCGGFGDPSGLNSAMNFSPGLGNFNNGGVPDLNSWMSGFGAGMEAASQVGAPGEGCQDPFCSGPDAFASATGDSSGNDPAPGATASAFASAGNPFSGTSNGNSTQQPPVINNITNNNESKKEEDGTPVILDGNGDGQIDTTGKGGNKINFDLNADGKADQTEWMKPGSQDGMLVSDFNGDGQINDGRELMRKTGEDGTQNKYQSGWDKVSKLFDKNHDGHVNGQELNGLQMWNDKNGDGKTDQGEMQSVRQMGISSIDLPQNGSTDSSFTRNGQQNLARDYNFEVNRWG